MSRAVHVDAACEQVLARCGRLQLGVTAAEALVSGGTRVVLATAADATKLVEAYGRRIIRGTVTRQVYGLRKR